MVLGPEVANWGHDTSCNMVFPIGTEQSQIVLRKIKPYFQYPVFCD